MEPLGVWEEKEIYLLREERKACFEIAAYNEEKTEVRGVMVRRDFFAFERNNRS